MIFSGIWGGFFEVFDAKFMKNLEKLSPEGLGTPKKRQRWAGLAGLVSQVGNVGTQMALGL